MPTGYTAGIIDGSIKTFEQYAKTCVRAFGAAIHMRDDSLSEEYVPREPGDYHLNALNRAKKQLNQSKKMTDTKIIKDRKKYLEDGKIHFEKEIVKINNNCIKMNTFMKKVDTYKPPTKEHYEIKKFMKEQLELTITQDGDPEYYETELNNIKEELKNINPIQIR